jgi:hypothetical protein
MSKNYFPDEQRDESVLMRRNDGDAAPQHAEHFNQSIRLLETCHAVLSTPRRTCDLLF